MGGSSSSNGGTGERVQKTTSYNQAQRSRKQSINQRRSAPARPGGDGDRQPNVVVQPSPPPAPVAPAPIPVPIPAPITPTVAEVSQSSATAMDGYDSRKTKRKGRSATIMTSSRGVQRDDTLTLGKPSLLGS